MRVFLLWVGTEPHRIHFEVMEYDRASHRMLVRCRDGTEYWRGFDPNMKYNRTDYRLVTDEDDDA
jgi:hypothetical protein